MATKTQSKPKAKKAEKKTTKEAKVCKKTYCCDGVSMKNFLILWLCIAAIILLVVAVFAFLIPLAK